MIRNILIAFLATLTIILSYREYIKKPVVEVRTEIVEIIKEIPKEPEVKEEPKINVQLEKTAYLNLPGWEQETFDDDLKKAFTDSCIKISSDRSEFLSGSQIKIPTATYKEICNKFLPSSQPFKEFIEQNFTPYLVTDNGNPIGKFTSYYESRINASRTKSDKYKHPIHGKPYDMVELRLQDFDPSLPNKTFVGRVKDNKFIKYFTRSEIYNSDINAPIILWGDDYIDIYVMQIQGSAVAHLDDGTDIRVAYADNNGHPFKGIGSILLSKKLLPKGQASMGNIKKWLKENGDLATKNMLENERYIFHRIVEAEGPIGAQGVPLRAGRSMAVDRSIIPLGSLLFINTTGPHNEKIEKLVVAQDIGSAIKGAVRGDYFWGSGDDTILDLAGKMNSQGTYYILLPKDIVIPAFSLVNPASSLVIPAKAGIQSNKPSF